MKDIEDGVEELHSKAFDPLGLDVDLTLESNGEHKLRSGKEEHKYNPATIHTYSRLHGQTIISYLNSIHT